MFEGPITALRKLMAKSYEKVENDIQYSWLMFNYTGNFDFMKK